MSTAGAVYLARERAELVRDDEPVEAAQVIEAEPQRWPLADCMSDRAIVEWWMVLREFDLQ
jgi:hypothetical protein